MTEYGNLVMHPQRRTGRQTNYILRGGDGIKVPPDGVIMIEGVVDDHGEWQIIKRNILLD